VSLGSATFTASQSAAPPTFNSSQVFQAAAGISAVNCANLGVGSTTLWATLTQDGAALPFTLSLQIPVTTTVVAARGPGPPRHLDSSGGHVPGLGVPGALPAPSGQGVCRRL
jgi:hypothetical protein